MFRSPEIMSFPMADGLQLLQQHVTWHIAGLQGDHDGCDVPILPAPILLLAGFCMVDYGCMFCITSSCLHPHLISLQRSNKWI